MLNDFRLPIGFTLPGGQKYKSVLHVGANWQIVESEFGIQALVVERVLTRKWLSSNLIGLNTHADFSFGSVNLSYISAGVEKKLLLVSQADSTFHKLDAIAFILALRETRKIDPNVPLQDSIYIEKLSRLLPTYSITTAVSDEFLLGYWLTGGVKVSIKSVRRLKQLVGTRFTDNELEEILRATGCDENVEELKKQNKSKSITQVTKSLGDENRDQKDGKATKFFTQKFTLPGRPNLTRFFNEHVIDVITNSEKYKQMGINFPSAIILHGPPGTGKTYAVERLAEFLGWPSYEVDSTSIGSPYIHETGRKIAKIFDSAIENAPSVLIIDEMESFLANRDMSSGHHRVEELAEFLRRIPEAVKNDVLIVSMTNRLDLIDDAILRRGRFDHVIKVEYANQEEIRELLDVSLSKVPVDKEIDTTELASELSGRPLSDVDYVLREGARLAVRLDKECLDQASILQAIENLKTHSKDDTVARKIGFV